MKIFFILLVTT